MVKNKLTDLQSLQNSFYFNNKPILFLVLQDHVVSQITLINGEKIWVREEKGPSWNHNSSAGSSHGSIGSTTSSTHDDCNSSTDSINICVGLPLLVSTSNQVAELDLSADMMDLSSLFNSTGRVCKNPKISETQTQLKNRVWVHYEKKFTKLV